MKSLEYYGVQEMSQHDTIDYQGGILPLLLIVATDAMLLGFMGGYIYESFASDH
ncbi:hypothetical protein [Flagellimonas sp.]|uniref:hypothetical protein n=1 Tax=Flagellimonas sp. TaxID=2058762 RepID=UPI003BA8F74C